MRITFFEILDSSYKKIPAIRFPLLESSFGTTKGGEVCFPSLFKVVSSLLFSLPSGYLANKKTSKLTKKIDLKT
jgi:hypothetical protein